MCCDAHTAVLIIISYVGHSEQKMTLKAKCAVLVDSWKPG